MDDGLSLEPVTSLQRRACTESRDPATAGIKAGFFVCPVVIAGSVETPTFCVESDSATDALEMNVASLGAMLLATLAGSSPAIAQVAIVSDGPSDLVNARVKTLSAEVQQLTRDDPNPIRMPSQPTHVGDYTLEGARQALRRALADRSVTAVVGIGYLAGVAVAELKKSPPKPVILPLAAPALQGLPQGKNRTGVRNLAYLSGPLDFESDIKRFREVIRDRKVAFMLDEYLWDIFLKNKPQTARRPFEGNPKVVAVSVPPTAEGAMAALPPDVEAAYLAPQYRLPSSEMAKLLQALNDRRIPTYVADPEWVERGAFVTLVPSDLTTERLRRVALYLRDAMSGGSLADEPITLVRRTELVINMATARIVNLFPSFELMTEARLVGDEQKTKGPELTIRQAINKGIERNPALEALRKQVGASKAELRESRGNLLPQLGLSGGFDWIDPDGAFINAERQVSLNGSASQVIYSPLALSAYFGQEDLYKSVQEQLSQGRLDLVLEVIQSYLNVLRTEAVQRLNRQNLGRIRTNRALAELRVEIGTSGRQDIARWDIELADGRAETIQASATRNQAEIDLNRILNVPLEEDFTTIDPDKDNDALLIEPRAQPYMEDLASFRTYRNFMAEEALAYSPELKQLDAQIAAQGNFIDGFVLNLFIPTLSTNFGFNWVLDRAGEAATIDGGFPRDDFAWQWGVALNFTVFDDVRYGTISRLRKGQSQLMSTRQDTANRIEQRVRAALHQLGSSRAAVNLRKDAVAAALVNLEAVTESYRQGRDTIITLIDAQNQALGAEINAANALYQYLSDFSAAERAAGRFLILLPPEMRDDFFSRLGAFAAEQRAKAQ